MVAAFPALLVLGIILLASTRSRAASPDSEILARAARKRATKKELEEARAVCRRLGLSRTEEALRKRIELRIMEPEIVSRVRGLRPLRSPFPDVSDEAWTEYTRRMVKGRAGERGPRGGLGMFGVTMRALVDAGLAHSPRKSATGEWTATFRGGMTEEKFLGSPRVQYRAFRKITKDSRNDVESSGALGREIEGRRATLSGLLAVAHHAGRRGLGKWIEGTPPREKFPATLGAYLGVNGLF
jgi:hypothetical protein